MEDLNGRRPHQQLLEEDFVLPDVVESVFDEGHWWLATLPLGLTLSQPLLQHGRVLPGQTPRGAQFRLDPFARHGQSFI